MQEVIRRHRPPGQLAPLVLLADADSVAATAATAARTGALAAATTGAKCGLARAGNLLAVSGVKGRCSAQWSGT